MLQAGLLFFVHLDTRQAFTLLQIHSYDDIREWDATFKKGAAAFKMSELASLPLILMIHVALIPLGSRPMMPISSSLIFYASYQRSTFYGRWVLQVATGQRNQSRSGPVSCHVQHLSSRETLPS